MGDGYADRFPRFICQKGYYAQSRLTADTTPGIPISEGSLESALSIIRRRRDEIIIKWMPTNKTQYLSPSIETVLHCDIGRCLVDVVAHERVRR